MLHRIEHKPIVWIDLQSPTPEEIEHVVAEFSLGPLIAEELATATIKPRVDLYAGFIYGVFHFPAFRHTHQAQENQEVDFVIGKNFIITTHYETIDPIHDFKKAFEAEALIAKDQKKKALHGGHIYFEMMRRLYRASDYELDYISDAIDRIENEIFAGHEREMVTEISNMSRELLNFKRIIATHKEVLDSLEMAGADFFGKEFVSYLKIIGAESFRVMHRADSLLDSARELRETNNSMLSTKQNEALRILSVMAFLTFPLVLVVEVLALDAGGTPIIHQQYGFWIIVTALLALAGSFVLYFKKKKWL